MIEKKLKRCYRCKILKPIEKFGRYKKAVDGFKYTCRDCFNEANRKRYKENPESFKIKNKKWRKNNPDIVNANSARWKRANPGKVQEMRKRWRENNKEYHKEYRKNNLETLKETSRKWEIDNLEGRKKIYKKFYSIPKNKLSSRILYSMSHSLRTNKSENYWENLVGYKLQDLITHLKSKFKESMTLENYGKWQIDHIRPISSFDFNSYEDPEFKQCWALDNLQPLWAEENRAKGKINLLTN